MRDDLKELEEALEVYERYVKEGRPQAAGDKTIVAAARRWLAASRGDPKALAELGGEEVNWCSVHRSAYDDGAPGCVFWMFAKVVESRYGTKEPRPCNVNRRVFGPLGGDE